MSVLRPIAHTDWEMTMDVQAARSTPEHEVFMGRCLELAAIAASLGNTPVGSIVVLDGRIVGEAGETLPSGSSVTGHAEVLACQAALDRSGRSDLAGAVLYSTAEPCFMCSYVIRQLRIAQVVFGLDTPVIGGATSKHPILSDPALDLWRPAPLVVGGVLRDECECVKATRKSTVPPNGR